MLFGLWSFSVSVLYLFFCRFFQAVDWSKNLPPDCRERHWLASISTVKQVGIKKSLRACSPKAEMGRKREPSIFQSVLISLCSFSIQGRYFKYIGRDTMRVWQCGLKNRNKDSPVWWQDGDRTKWWRGSAPPTPFPAPCDSRMHHNLKNSPTPVRINSIIMMKLFYVSPGSFFTLC